MKPHSVWVAALHAAADGRPSSFQAANFQLFSTKQFPVWLRFCQLATLCAASIALSNRLAIAQARSAELIEASSAASSAGVTISCPPDIQLQFGQSPEVAITGLATAVANCGAGVNVTYSDAPLPADCTEMGLERTWTASGCGKKSVTCTQRITFVDNHPPMFLSFPLLEEIVPCGGSVPKPVLLDILDDFDSNPSLVVTDTQTDPWFDGGYSIMRRWTATDACGNSSWQTQLISVQGCPPAESLSVIEAVKFYDANANGVQDEDEAPISGWRIELSGGPDDVALAGVTDASGRLVFAGVKQGSYLLRSAEPVEAGWQDTTSDSFVISLGDEPESRDFGGLCLGSGQGRSVEFWADKSGQRLLNSSKDSIDLAGIRQLALRNSDGSDFDPTSVNQLRSWFAAASGMYNVQRLSAELAAMTLSAEVALLQGASRVRAPGTAAANGLGYAAVGPLVAEVNRELSRDSRPLVETVDPAAPTYRGALENALRAANNNESFIQSVICPFNFAKP